MPLPSALDICRNDLYTAESELREKYPAPLVDKVLRVREMVNWRLANPGATERAFIDEVVTQFGVSRVSAYGDLNAVRALLPLLTEHNTAYYRWRYSEMISETYEKAKARGDTKTMERCASSMAKYMNIQRDDELEDVQQLYEKISPQPFVPTDDPRVIGIEPIPNINARISELLEKYRAETLDIDAVDFEPEDVEFEDIFDIVNNPPENAD